MFRNLFVQVQGNALLTHFYVTQLRALYSLPLPLKNPEVLAAVLPPGKPYELRVGSAVSKRYYTAIEDVRDKIRALNQVGASYRRCRLASRRRRCGLPISKTLVLVNCVSAVRVQCRARSPAWPVVRCGGG